MIITKLILDNFLSHEHSEIEFSHGINVIIGKTGAGKSSILDGIKFALFGKSSRGNLTDLVRHGRTSFSVHLFFRVNDDEFEIFRSISFTPQQGQKKHIRGEEAEIRRGSSPVAQGIKAVNSYVESLFKMNRELFTSSVFVEQGEVARIVAEDPSQRKSLFSEIIGIDPLKRKADALKGLIKDLVEDGQRFVVHPDDIEQKKEVIKTRERELRENSEKIERYEGELRKLNEEYAKAEENARNLIRRYTLIEQKKNDLESKKASLEDLKKERESLLEERSKYSEVQEKYKRITEDPLYRERDRLTEVRRTIDNMKNVDDKIAELERDIIRLNEKRQRADALSKEEARYTEVQNHILEMQKGTEERENIIRKYDFVSSKLDENERHLEALHKKLASLTTGLPPEISDLPEDEIRRKAESLQAEFNQISKDLGSDQMEIKNLERRARDARKKLEMVEGRKICPVCGSPLTDEHLKRITNDYSTEMEEISLKKGEVEKRIRDYEQRRKSIQDKLNILRSDSVNRLVQIRNDREKVSSEIKDLTIQLESLKDEYTRAREQVQRLRELQNAVSRLEKPHAEYVSIIGSIHELESKRPEEILSQLRARKNELKGGLKSLLSDLKIDPNDVSAALSRISAMTEEKRKLEPQIQLSVDIDRKLEENSWKQNSLENEISTIEKEVIEFDKVEMDLKRATDEQRKLKNQLEEKNASISALKGRSAQLDDNLRELKGELRAMEERFTKYQKIQEGKKILEEIRNSLEKDGIQKYIREESSEAITLKTRNLVSEFGLNIDDVRVNQDFDVIVTVDGAQEPLQSLSGGEKTAIAIALRLSVARYITDRMNVIIMDEPTTNLDSDRRNQLKSILQSALRDQSVVPQLIVVTHHDEITQAADTVYKVVREGGPSSITYVS